MRRAITGGVFMFRFDDTRATEPRRLLLVTLLVAAGVQAQAPSAQAPQAAPASAAVPAVVAMPRPTAAELQTARDSFAKFLASAGFTWPHPSPVRAAFGF